MRDSHTTELYGYGTMWCITVVSRRLSCVVVAGSSLQRTTRPSTVHAEYTADYESKTDVRPRTMRAERESQTRNRTRRGRARSGEP